VIKESRGMAAMLKCGTVSDEAPDKVGVNPELVDWCFESFAPMNSTFV
jgi:hypothetical protein